MKPYETLGRVELLHGNIIDVVRDTISLPDGRSAQREMVIHGGACAILPVDSDGNIIFVRQYRHPAGEEVLEIPAGMLEEGEDPKECAIRELEEETGYKTENVKFMFSMYSAIGFCNEVLYVYLARDLKPGVVNLDEDEFVTVEKYSIEKATNMIFENKIKDSKTIAAVFACKDVLNRL